MVVHRDDSDWTGEGEGEAGEGGREGGRREKGERKVM